MHKLLLIAASLAALTGKVDAQLSLPKAEAVYGGTVNAIIAVPLSPTQTRVFISTMSANSIFYSDMTTGDSSAPTFGEFAVLPGAGAQNGFGPNVTQMAVHKATGDVYFVTSTGSLVKTNPSGSGPITLEPNGVGAVRIVNTPDSIAYIFTTDPTGLRYGTIDRGGNITEGASSPLKLNTNIQPPSGPFVPTIHPDPVSKRLYYAQFSSTPVLYVTSAPYDSFSAATNFLTVNTTPLSDGSAQWTAFGVGNDGTLFFGGTDNFEKVVAYSKDGGNSWTIDSTQYSGMGGPDFAFSRSGSSYTVYFSTLYATYDSSTGFSSWRRMGDQGYETHPNDGSVCVDPHNDSVVYVVTDQGLGVSVNGGSVLKEIDDGIAAVQVNALVLDSTKTDGWVASKAGIRHVTNYSSAPVWSVAMFPNSDGAPYYAAAMVGNDPNSVFVGNARVYKTTDAGSTWQMAFDAENPPYDFNTPSAPLIIDAISVDPYDTNMVMAGYGPQSQVGDSAQGGVFYSTDGGANWSQLLCLAASAGHDINATSIVFTREGDSTAAYIGASYDPYIPDSTLRGKGVYRAVWNGSSWSVRQDMSSVNSASGKDIDASINALALSSGGDTLYAAGSDETSSVPEIYYKALNGSGVWNEIGNAGLPAKAGNFVSSNYVKAMAMGRDTLYCGINNDIFIRDITSDTSWTPGFSYPIGDPINVLYYDDLLVGTGTGLYGQHITGGATGIESRPITPEKFQLLQNYPNPFNPNTVINYQLPKISRVTLKVYDVLGREVATLVNGVKPAGEYSAVFDGGRLPSGVYFYRLKAGGLSITRKMVLLK